MLYTVRPLERIYAAPSVFDHTKENKEAQEMNTNQAEFKDVQLPNGRIVTRREGENYIIEHINSTDMKDYLNEEYIPGNHYKSK